MGDTKRGRERKGRDKRRQRILEDAKRELDADETPPEPDDEDLEIGD